jgi:hypothetical protein
VRIVDRTCRRDEFLVSAHRQCADRLLRHEPRDFAAGRQLPHAHAGAARGGEELAVGTGGDLRWAAEPLDARHFARRAGLAQIEDLRGFAAHRDDVAGIPAEV